MKKFLLIFVLTVILTLSIVSCGDNDYSQVESTVSTTSDVNQSSDTVVTTETSESVTTDKTTTAMPWSEDYSNDY